VASWLAENTSFKYNEEDFPIFKESYSWVSRFKKTRIISRKVTNFVTRRTLEDSVNLQKNY